MDYSFGFAKTKSAKRFQIKIWIWICFFCVVGYICIRIFHFTQFVIQASDDPARLIVTDIRKFASYTDLIDPKLTQLIDRVQAIQNSYFSGDNIFREHEQDIMYILTMVQTHYHHLIQYLPSKYRYMAEQLYDLSFRYDLIRHYLGADQIQHYLVILQNTAEKRPNGGFFGSFAIVTVDGGHITRFKVIDSYYPNHIAPDMSVSAPLRASAFLPTLDMGFVSINKFGFTDLDGRNIADLYQKIFDQPIAGVIFVRTDIFAYIIPDFAKQIRELQFMNATVDLRRKQNLPNKKEYYLKYINDYFATHKYEIVFQVIQNIQYIADQHWIQIYLTDRNTQMEDRLKKNKLTTIYDTGTMYLRDTNIAYNKLDAFVSKYVELRNEQGVLISQTHNDYLDINGLPDGIYDLWIYYHLNIPADYKQNIKNLVHQYKVNLTERERHILGMTNTRDTRGMIYMPLGYEIIHHSGDHYHYQTFDTDFSRNIVYKVTNTHNHSSKIVKFRFQVK